MTGGSSSRVHPADASMRIKVCGVTRPADARAVARAGADLMGAVLVPSSPRAVSPSRARALGREAGLPLAVVVAGLSPAEMATAAEEAGAAVIQLHGNERPEILQCLRREGAWELWKAVRVKGAQDIRDAFHAYRTVADLLLMDGWHPVQLGGTGTRFPWQALDSEIRGLVPSVGVGIAGGLTPENVAEAVTRFRPRLVDVSSGVEDGPGRKNASRIRDFVAQAREAAASHTHQQEEP